MYLLKYLRITSGIILSSIFVLKLIFTVLPAFVNFNDKDVKLVMLEFENEDAKQTEKDAKDLDNGKKEVLTINLTDFHFQSHHLKMKRLYQKNHQFSLIEFFPSIPTPPPNFL